MVWQPEIEELEYRRSLAMQMGGEERIERQHSEGKLTVRERIDTLLDPDTFFEIGELAGYGEYDEDRNLTGFTPMPYVTDLGRIDGQLVVVGGEDFTVRGGTAVGPERRCRKNNKWAYSFALQFGVPLIYMADGAGASVRGVQYAQGGHLPSSDDFTSEVEMLGKVPVVSAIVGSVAGRPAGGRCWRTGRSWSRVPARYFLAGRPWCVAPSPRRSTRSRWAGHTSTYTRAARYTTRPRARKICSIECAST